MKKIKYFIFSVIVLLLIFFVYNLTYTYVEPKAYDFMVKNVLTEKLPFDNQKNIYGHDDIVLVVIDEATVEKYRWPWKREVNCKIFNYFLEYAQPKVVVHDAIVASLDKDNPESDKKFFNTLNKFDNLVVGFMPTLREWEDENAGKNYENKFIQKFKLNFDDKSNLSSALYSAIMPFPDEYFNVIKHTGSVFMIPGFIVGDLIQGVDEVYRNHEYVLSYKGNLLPSLAMQTFLVANNYPKGIVAAKSIAFPEINYKINVRKTDWQLISPIKFYKLYGRSSLNSGYTHTKYSALDIMNSYDAIKLGKKPKINPDIFKDKIVVIGANVPAGTGLNDNKNSPIMANHPGVDIQATAIDNIFHNDFLNVLPKWFNLLIMFLGMVFVYFTIRTQELVKAIILTILTIITYIAICAACFYYSIVINIITPVVMFIITMIIAYIHRYVIEFRNKKKVENALGKYMSEDVMKNVIQNIDNLGLGGKKAVVTVLFSDIRGFTSLSERLSAEEVTSLLNEYFSEMEPLVSKYDGIINKFIGDAVMAIFGEPIHNEQHPQNAVLCGYEMIKKVEEMKVKWSKEGKPQFDIGIGISTGEVFVGNIGSAKRMEYTVIGDTVNLASRLESYNKTYKTKILISASTYEAAKDIMTVNEIENAEIRGKANKINIYEVTGIK